LHSAGIDDADVCIAACLPKLTDETTENDLEDEETVDDFFSQNRFEYVSVEKTNGTTQSLNGELLCTFMFEICQYDTSIVIILTDATGINRIREALHAIMWPSLVRKKPLAKSRSMPVVFNDDSIDGGEGLSLSIDDITEDIARSLFTMPDGASRENELAALEAWLDQDPSETWKEPQNGGPTQENPWSGSTQSQSTVPTRFDDDFSDFISAAAMQGRPSDPSTDDAQGSLAPEYPGDDPFIPSSTDVAAASSRIFKPTGGGSAAEGLEAFDLNQVLSTLQAMKEEISLIEDIDKKRRAAAAAALGLVSGLGLGAGEDDDDSELGELLTI
jgi:hypothetical protein